MILIWEKWALTGSWSDGYSSTEYTYNSQRWYFDTILRAVVGPITGEPGQQETNGGQQPQDYVHGGEFYHECVSLVTGAPATTRRGYVQIPFVYNDFEVVDIPNATECGFVPPPACTLIIEHVAVGVNQAEVTISAAVGTVRLSIDGGATWSTSTLIEDLDPGTYTLIVEDQGVPGCTQTSSFTIEPLPPAAPVQPAIVFSQNPLFVQLMSTRPYRRLLITLHLETEHRSNVFRPAFSLEQTTNGAAKAVFRYDRELDALLPDDIPDPTMSVPTRLKGRIRRYYIRFAEINPRTGAPGGTQEANIQTVIKGGLPEPMAGETDFFGTLWPATKMFLTWAPRTIRIAPGQVTFLDVLLNGIAAGGDANAAFKVVVQRYSAGGATLGAAIEETVTFPTALGQTLTLWRLPIRATYSGVRFTVKVVKASDNTLLSEVRTFEFVRGLDRPRQFLLIGSLGSVDTLLLAGRLQGRQSVERESAEHLRKPEDLSMAGAAALTMWRRTGRETLKASTGWLTPEEIDWMREFFLSTKIWEVVNNRLRPVELMTKEFDFFSDDPDLGDAEIEYRHAYPQNHYGLHATTTFNRPPVSDAGGDGGSGDIS